MRLLDFLDEYKGAVEDAQRRAKRMEEEMRKRQAAQKAQANRRRGVGWT